MKRCILGIFLIILCFSLFAQKESAPEKEEFHHFAITRPTVSNLERFDYFVRNQIINIPDLKILAVYYEKEEYNYEKSKNFIQHYDGPVNFTLLGLEGAFTIENVYSKNPLTKYFQQIFNHTQGILFFGGDDIQPAAYNEKMSLLTDVDDAYRHYFELSFLFHLLGGFQDSSFVPLLDQNEEYVIWAFCLGMQTMNVATGGTLVQDIPNEIYNVEYVEDVISMDKNNVHKNYFRVLYPEKGITGGKLHPVKFTDQSPLKELSPDNPTPSVYSYHHQCVEKLGKGLVPIAYSMDGKIVEAVAHERFENVLAFQFHPEKVGLYDTNVIYLHTPEDKVQKSYKTMLVDNKSFDFHVSIWKEFSKTFINFNH